MRLFYSAVVGTLLLSGCATTMQTPTEPTVVRNSDQSIEVTVPSQAPIDEYNTPQNEAATTAAKMVRPFSR